MAKLLFCFIILLIIPTISAISNVHHVIDGNKITINYDGSPPFLINVRSDKNIGDSGGYIWAKTSSKSTSFDFGSFSNSQFYYGVKDSEWSDTFPVSVGLRDAKTGYKAASIQSTDGDGQKYVCGISTNEHFCNNCTAHGGIVREGEAGCWCESKGIYINAWFGECPHQPQEKVLVIINDYILPHLQNELDQYRSDVKKELDYEVIIQTISNEGLNWRGVYSIIEKEFQEGGLKGVLLIGNIPSVRLHSPYYTYTARIGLSDNFYAEIHNTKCPYNSEKDAFDVGDSESCLYTDNILPKEHPFWVARLTPPKTNCLKYDDERVYHIDRSTNTYFYLCLDLQQDLNIEDINLIKKYFQRNHAFRTGKLQYDKKILYYKTIEEEPVPEGFKRFTDYDELNLFKLDLYDRNDLIYSDGSSENQGNEFLQELEKPYEFLLVNAHGTSFSHDHNIYGDRIKKVGPIIVHLKSCSTGDHSRYDNIAANYLFKGSLIVSASTIPKQVGFRIPSKMMDLLTGGYTYSQTHSLLNYPETEIIFGDPTLKMRYEPNPLEESRPILTLLDKEVSVNMKGKDEMITSIRIRNDGKSDLLFYKLPFKYDAESEPIARVVGTFSFDPLRPGQEKELKFIVSKLRDGPYKSKGRMYFLTNNINKRLSDEVIFVISNS